MAKPGPPDEFATREAVPAAGFLGLSEIPIDRSRFLKKKG